MVRGVWAAVSRTAPCTILFLAGTRQDGKDGHNVLGLAAFGIPLIVLGNFHFAPPSEMSGLGHFSPPLLPNHFTAGGTSLVVPINDDINHSSLLSTACGTWVTLASRRCMPHGEFGS